MTSSYSGYPEGYGAPPPAPKKKRRVFLWIFLAVQALFLVWLVSGIASASGTPDNCGGLTAEDCNAAEAAGAGIGVALVIIVWAFVDFLVFIPWAVYKMSRR